MKNLPRLLVLLGAIWLLVGCGSDKGTSTPTPDTTQPDTTVTIPDVEPTPDTTRPPTTRPPTTRPRTTRPPTTSPPTTAPPTTSPPTTLSSVINGQCGTVIETCAAGKYINLSLIHI